MVSINLTSVSLFGKVFHLGSWKTKPMVGLAVLKESTPSILCFYFRFFKPVLDGQVSIIIVSFSNVLFAQNFWTSYQLKVYFFFCVF